MYVYFNLFNHEELRNVLLKKKASWCLDSLSCYDFIEQCSEPITRETRRSYRFLLELSEGERVCCLFGFAPVFKRFVFVFKVVCLLDDVASFVCTFCLSMFLYFVRRWETCVDCI